MTALISQFPKAHGLAIVLLFVTGLSLAVWPQQSRSVQIPIELPELDGLIDELTNQETVTVKEFKVASGDTLSLIFDKAGIPAQTMYRLLESKEHKRLLRAIQPGETMKFITSNQGDLEKFEYVLSPVLTESFSFTQEGVLRNTLTREPELVTRYAETIIDSSLFLSAKNAGLSEQLTMEMAQIFAWDIDFALDIRKGDRFSLIYQEKYLDGEKLGYGPILAATFINNGNDFTAIRYTNSEGETGFYSPDGHSMRKAFLRTPLDYARISSHFNPKRKHPILNKIRAHKGTDYAAPSGTPIKAAGDGKVTFAGVKGGYGKTIVLQHGQTYSTLYAHMRNFHKSIRKGKTVKQGQIIGYVGNTGLSTGPHLHYEFRVNGVHRNPVTVKLPDAQPVPEKYREDFLAHAANMQGQLAIFQANAYALLAE